jgi:hypothetical protein
MRGTVRRFVSDESGMTLVMAMIMIVLMGVMGAGLLTFVMRDLNTVIEENRGQRAFQVADAGIEAAKHQLASNVVTTDYDDPIANPLAPVDDIQWSAAAGGVTLNDLDDDDDVATADSVNVKIKYRTATTDFRVISEGTYGVAKRKIEAIFGPPTFDPNAPGQQGQPVYYTPSGIMIDGPDVGLKGISMFSRKDILIEDGRTDATTTSTAYSYACFKADYEDKTAGCSTMPNSNTPNHGTLAKMQGTGDELCDWYSPQRRGDCFKLAIQRGNYNTTARPTDRDVGLGAEGKICSVPPGSADINGPEVGIGACGTRPSVVSAVDGYAYDSTTTPRFVAKELLNPPLDPGRDGDPNLTGTITYPFPRLTPNPEYFRCAAKGVSPCNATNSAGYWVGQPTDSTWGLSTSSANKVAFVDAQGGTVRFNPDASGKGGSSGDKNNTGSSYKGIIVVWCGNLQQDDNFRGIILNLIGNDLGGNTQCGSEVDGPSTSNVGVYSNNGASCTCWVYAGGGTSTRAGIILRPGSSADFLPGGSWDNLPTTAFDGPPPTEFVIRSWRELYS